MTAKSLVIFLEMQCDEYELPPGHEAIISLDDGTEGIDIYDGQVTIWDNSCEAKVEIAPIPAAS